MSLAVRRQSASSSAERLAPLSTSARSRVYCSGVMRILRWRVRALYGGRVQASRPWFSAASATGRLTGLRQRLKWPSLLNALDAPTGVITEPGTDADLGATIATVDVIARTMQGRQTSFFDAPVSLSCSISTSPTAITRSGAEGLARPSHPPPNSASVDPVRLEWPARQGAGSKSCFRVGSHCAHLTA